MTQTVTERVSGKSVTKRDVSLDSKESTRHFVTNFLQKLAKKSYPLIKNQIMSVFSNESKTFLPLPADTVKRVELANNLIVIRSIQRIRVQLAGSRISGFRW